MVGVCFGLQNMSSSDALAKAIGQEDAEAVLRLLNGCPLATLMDAAKDADQEWTEWARAAACLQRWAEARDIHVDAQRKIGYLSCAVEGAKTIPVPMRPPLSQTVTAFLETHGLSVE
jgi:hypothetical protein